MRKSIENLAGRKYTGGKKIQSHTRRKHQIDRYPNEPVQGTQNIISRNVRGNNTKQAIKSTEYANINDPNNRKTIKSKIIRVLRNPANKDYERRGVLSKGAVIETELGTAKIVSRPGQSGSINAILQNES